MEPLNVYASRLVNSQEYFTPGHRACQGCAEALAVRLVAKALGENICNTNRLKNESNALACNDTGTRFGRQQQDTGCAELPDHLVSNGAIHDREPGHRTICRLGCFLHSQRYFHGLAVSVANSAVSITGHDKSRKTESSTTLDHAGASPNLNDRFT